jgi:Cu-processing system ATP-binding protein
VGLAHAGKRPVREYSKGMRQRLGFAQALLGTPQVLFLDEPTNGLDPQAIRDFYATLRGLQAEGVTIIITSHILAELQERVGRLAIMAAGKRCRPWAACRHCASRPTCRWCSSCNCKQETRPPSRRRWRTPRRLHPEPTRPGCACLPARAKMAVLAALAPFGARVLDIKMHEPSLEDVFFGFSD